MIAAPVSTSENLGSMEAKKVEAEMLLNSDQLIHMQVMNSKDGSKLSLPTFVAGKKKTQREKESLDYDIGLKP